jgi:hypothetical protein
MCFSKLGNGGSAAPGMESNEEVAVSKAATVRCIASRVLNGYGIAEVTKDVRPTKRRDVVSMPRPRRCGSMDSDLQLFHLVIFRPTPASLPS